MQRTLKDLLVTCQKENQADPLKYPSQILCLSDNISFTQKCEQAISSMTLPALLAKYKVNGVDFETLKDKEVEILDIFQMKIQLNVFHLQLPTKVILNIIC